MVAGRPERSRRMLIADRAFHRGIVGWPGERCRYCLRVRQGEVDRRGAEARREPQGDGQDVSAYPPVPTVQLSESFEIEGRQMVAHAQGPATRANNDEDRSQQA